MPTTIFEQIAQNVLSALQAITTANSYEIQPLVRRGGTVKTPLAWNVDGNGAAAAIELRLEQYNLNGGMAVEPMQPLVVGKQYFFVHFVVLASIEMSQSPQGGEATQYDAVVNQISASVIKALMVDPQRGTFNSVSNGNPLAIDTVVGETISLTKTDDGMEGCGIAVRVQCRTAMFDAYTQ